MKLSIPKLNGATVKVWEWKSNYIPHFTGHAITYPCWNYSYTMLVNGWEYFNVQNFLKRSFVSIHLQMIKVRHRLAIAKLASPDMVVKDVIYIYLLKRISSTKPKRQGLIAVEATTQFIPL